MKQGRQYFEGDLDKRYVIQSLKKYVKNKQELDKKLEKLITPFIKDKSLRILDACCGIGHIDYFLSSISPSSQFFGIDQTSYLIDEANKLCKKKKNITFEVDDIYNLPRKHKKEFDISINWKTLSWLPNYEDCIKILFDITKSHIFLSSLFYDEDIDFEIKVKPNQSESAKEDHFFYYNVYSIPKFTNFVYGLGAKNVSVYDFEINKELPKPPTNMTGTYTLNLENGKKIQLSGIILMNWKIIRIDL